MTAAGHDRAHEATPTQQQWAQAQVDAFQRLLAARPRLNGEQLTGAVANRPAVARPAPTDQSPVSAFEPAQPRPASPLVLPVPAGTPQLASGPSPRRRRPAWLLVALALTLAVGLGTGFVLGSTREDNTRSSAPPSPDARSPTTAAPRPPWWSERRRPRPAWRPPKRGDELVSLLIQNKRSRASKLLVPYHVATRQCAKDAAP